MNERIKELAFQAGFSLDSTGIYTAKLEHLPITENMEKFALLIVQDYARKTIQGLMSDPVFVQAMDEYYEQKWAHRFD